MRKKTHPVNYGSSVNWGWLKGSLVLPVQPYKWVMAPEDEKPWGINLNLVQLNTVLVFLSTWGQEITRLSFPAWQKGAEFGEGGADGSTEPCCFASTCLKGLFCVGSVAGKADRITKDQSLGALKGAQKACSKAITLGLLKWGVAGLHGNHTEVFSGKRGRGRGLFSKTTRSLLLYRI